MCKKILLSLLVLVFVTNTAAALNTDWQGGTSTDWTDPLNWGSGLVPTSADWADIRNGDWIVNFPVIPTGVTANARVMRMGPNFGNPPQTGMFTMDGGTLNLQQEMYIGDSGGPFDFTMNSGTVNVGLAGLVNNSFTAVGGQGGTGQLFMNGGTFNAGQLGVPKWFDGIASKGNVFIDGGNLNTSQMLLENALDDQGLGSGIQFTKDLAVGGGLLTDTQDLGTTAWTNWQAQVGNWISAGLISTSTGGLVEANFSSVGTVRTTEISSVVRVPGVRTWTGTVSNDWSNGQNWNGGIAPDSADHADIRSDGFVTFFPDIPTGATVEAKSIRMNPGNGTQTTPITIAGGTLNVQESLDIGDLGTGGADVIMNSGVVNVGLSGTNAWTAVGGKGGTGQLFVNGGTFNAGILGVPKWFDGIATMGNVFIDGGNLNTSQILIEFAAEDQGLGSGIQFTKDLAVGGGKITDTQDIVDPVEWLNWQGQVDQWIDAGIISTSTGGTVLMVGSSVGTIRTLEIFSVPAIPGDFTSNGKVTGRDFLKWQRGETPLPLSATDLNTWIANYGTVAGPGVAAGAAAVPEPASILLAAFGMVVLSTRRRLRN